MIRYALACDNGHAFESWFGSADGYDRQVLAGLVECPLCGSARVTKSIMAPAVATRAAAAPAVPAPSADPSPAVPETPAQAPQPQPFTVLSEREHAMRAMLRSLREHVTRTADYVGPRFAAEARKMHEGEIEHRSIYGEANALEARALLDDGIEVHPLPVLPDDRN